MSVLVPGDVLDYVARAWLVESRCRSSQYGRVEGRCSVPLEPNGSGICELANCGRTLAERSVEIDYRVGPVMDNALLNVELIE